MISLIKRINKFKTKNWSEQELKHWGKNWFRDKIYKLLLN